MVVVNINPLLPQSYLYHIGIQKEYRWPEEVRTQRKEWLEPHAAIFALAVTILLIVVAGIGISQIGFGALRDKQTARRKFVETTRVPPQSNDSETENSRVPLIILVISQTPLFRAEATGACDFVHLDINSIEDDGKDFQILWLAQNLTVDTAKSIVKLHDELWVKNETLRDEWHRWYKERGLDDAELNRLLDLPTIPNMEEVVSGAIVRMPFILAPGNASSPLILAPLIESPFILSPYIFGPFIISPLVEAPAILSPSILSPPILSPAVLSPLVLSSQVLNPFILSPQVLSPSILSPSVLSPNILSPSVLSPCILSPRVLSPSLFSPSVLAPDILCPSLLSDGVDSPSVLSEIGETNSQFLPCFSKIYP